MVDHNLNYFLFEQIALSDILNVFNEFGHRCLNKKDDTF